MQQNNSVIQNVLWFLASLALAFFVWLIATTQADPIQERSFSNVPIQSLNPNAGLIVTNTSTIRRAVRVFVQARKSVLDLLTEDDLTVTADLSALGPGSHQVELKVNVARSPSSADTQPAQITVLLEQELSQQKPVSAQLLNEPPAGYIVENITLSETQVLVRGVASRVQQVARVEAQIDLRDQRNTLDQEFQLLAVDENGTVISDVTIAQPVIRATVNITQSENLRVISVQPSIAFDTGAEGYVFQLEDYSPTTITFRGGQVSLNQLPESLSTVPIELEDRTEDFSVSVPLNLPDDLPEDVVIEGSQLIDVSITVETNQTTRQFDNVRVTVFGLDARYTARAIPSRVNVLVTGPQPVLDSLTEDQIRVEVNLQGLQPGAHDVQPTARIVSAEIAGGQISVLPTQIGVIISLVPTIEVTPDD